MPAMTGYELAKRIIAIRPGIPVMLCTGYSESMSEDKALEAGIKAFIMKPLQLNEIAQAIRAVLDNKK